ncbi:STAS-like domain-containing protein [Candidatus Woesearchaeota archaeon]|nr:STAS-like domain-containing protein [Candidatus Woesearchaeota archaeon]
MVIEGFNNDFFLLVVDLNFEGVDSATQSFVHALISDVIRKYSVEIIDRISFKNCSTTIRKIIEIVIDYMQESEM